MIKLLCCLYLYIGSICIIERLYIYKLYESSFTLLFWFFFAIFLFVSYIEEKSFYCYNITIDLLKNFFYNIDYKFYFHLIEKKNKQFSLVFFYGFFFYFIYFKLELYFCNACVICISILCIAIYLFSIKPIFHNFFFKYIGIQ